MPDQNRGRDGPSEGNDESGAVLDEQDDDVYESTHGRTPIRDLGVGSLFDRESSSDDDPYLVSSGAVSRGRSPSSEEQGGDFDTQEFCPSCGRTTPHEDVTASVEGDSYRQTADGLRRVEPDTVTVSLCMICGSPSPSSPDAGQGVDLLASDTIRPFAPDQLPREHEAFARSEREREEMD